MSRRKKFTIFVDTGRSSQRIHWQGHGQHGLLNLGTTTGDLLNQPIIGGLTSKLYWEAILAQVVAGIPGGS